MSKIVGTSTSFKIFDENPIRHSTGAQLPKLTKFPCRGESKKSLNSEPPKKTPETMKFPSEIPPAPMKPRRTTKKIIATPKRLEFPEAEDENSETPKTSALCPRKPEEHRYPTRATIAAQKSKTMNQAQPTTSKAKPAKLRNTKIQRNEDKENNSGAANRQIQQSNSNKNRTQRNTVNQSTLQNLAMPEESNADRATEIAASQFSICASDNPREHLRWLHKRRDIGLWIQCCHSKCKKWRYTEHYHDPVDVPEIWYCEYNKDPDYADCSVPQEEISSREAEVQIYNLYNAGSIVWARINGYPWWPAMVDDSPETLQYYKLKRNSQIPSQYHVTFFNDIIERDWLAPRNLKPYKDNPRETFLKKTIYRHKDYSEDLNLPCEQASQALELSIYERLQRFSYVARTTSNAPVPPIDNRKEKRDASVMPEEPQPPTKRRSTKKRSTNTSAVRSTRNKSKNRETDHHCSPIAIRSRKINGDTDTVVPVPLSSNRFTILEKAGTNVDKSSSPRRSRSMTRRADKSSNFGRNDQEDISRPPLAPLSITGKQRPSSNVQKTGKFLKKASENVASKPVADFNPQPSTSKSGRSQPKNFRQNEAMDTTDEESSMVTDTQNMFYSQTIIPLPIVEKFLDSGIDTEMSSLISVHPPKRTRRINDQPIPSKSTKCKVAKSATSVDPLLKNIPSQQNGIPEVIDLSNDDELRVEELTREEMLRIVDEHERKEAEKAAAAAKHDPQPSTSKSSIDTKSKFAKSSTTIDPPLKSFPFHRNENPEVVDSSSDNELCVEELTREEMLRIVDEHERKEAEKAAVASDGKNIGNRVPNFSPYLQEFINPGSNWASQTSSTNNKQIPIRFKANRPQSVFPQTAEFLQRFQPRKSTSVNFPSAAGSPDWRLAELEDIIDDDTSSLYDDDSEIMVTYASPFSRNESNESFRNGNGESVVPSLSSLENELSSPSQRSEFGRPWTKSGGLEISPLTTSSQVSAFPSPIPMETDESFSDEQQFDADVEMIVTRLERSRSSSKSMSFGSGTTESSIVPSSQPSQDSLYERLPKFPGLIVSRIPNERGNASLEVTSRHSSVEVITIID